MDLLERLDERKGMLGLVLGAEHMANRTGY